MRNQHVVSDICLLEVLCFLEVDMNYLQIENIYFYNISSSATLKETFTAKY